MQIEVVDSESCVILLTYAGWCNLLCQKIPEADMATAREGLDEPSDEAFDMLPALNEGFFTDLTLTSKSRVAVS